MSNSTYSAGEDTPSEIERQRKFFEGYLLRKQNKINLLEEYAIWSRTPVRDLSNLSPLEEWLISKIIDEKVSKKES